MNSGYVGVRSSPFFGCCCVAGSQTAGLLQLPLLRISEPRSARAGAYHNRKLPVNGGFSSKPGFSATRIRQLGGGATQLSINAGNPVISGSQFDLGAFVGDDYKVRPNFSLSLELRYEARRTAGAGGVDGVGGFIQSESGNREREYRSEPELLAQCGAGIFSESATDRRLERQTRFTFCSSGTQRGSVRSIYRAWR